MNTLKVFVRFIAFCFFWIGLLSACGVNTPATLEFELIEESDWGIDYTSETRNFWVVSSPESIALSELNISKPITDKLLAIDYNEQFAVVIFRGAMGVVLQQPLITLETVTWDSKDEIILNVVFRDTSNDQGENPATSSPYYIAAVDKPVVEGQDVRFILQSDGEVVAEQTVYFP